MAELITKQTVLDLAYKGGHLRGMIPAYEVEKLPDLTFKEILHAKLAAAETENEENNMNTINYEQRAEIYAQAAEVFGQETQTIVAIEEMAELQKELCKVRRLEGQLGHMAEEIADVTIMLEQLRIMYGVNELVGAYMDAKVSRLAERVEQARVG